MTRQKYFSIFLLLVFVTQACARIEARAPVTSPTQNTVLPTKTQLPTQTPRPSPTATKVTPTITVTSAPKATITAVKGNIFIRRGPDFAYNPIGVLYKDTTAEILMRDVLSNWVQIVVPNTTDTKGWVSVLTRYSKVEGDLYPLPEFSITDWPKPAYLRNCTHHQMRIEPGRVFLDSSYTIENEVMLNPGHYYVVDLEDPSSLAFLEVDLMEGKTVEINEDAFGKHRKCPQ